MEKLSSASILFLVLFNISSCKKNSSVSGGGGINPPPPPSSDSVYNPTDPSLAASIGFFNDGWKPKSFTVPGFLPGSVASNAATDSLTIDVNKVLVKVPPYVY